MTDVDAPPTRGEEPKLSPNARRGLLDCSPQLSAVDRVLSTASPRFERLGRDRASEAASGRARAKHGP